MRFRVLRELNSYGIEWSLLSHETGGWCHPFSRVAINVDRKKRVDLGVLRGADHDGLGTQVPFEMVSGDREEQVFNMP